MRRGKVLMNWKVMGLDELIELLNLLDKLLPRKHPEDPEAIDYSFFGAFFKGNYSDISQRTRFSTVYCPVFMSSDFCPVRMLRQASS